MTTTQTTPGKIFSLISKVMADIKPVGKDQLNKGPQSYKFRGIDDMYNCIQPALVKHGVFCCPQVLKTETFDIEYLDRDGQTRRAYRVLHTITHRFYADDGSFIEVITVGEGIDRSDKASNKAMSGAMKYAFIELFSIPTQDIEDADRDDPLAGSAKHKINHVTQVGEGFLD